VESEIPFLQTVLKDFKIVPIVMTDQSFTMCELLATHITKTIEKLGLQDVLLVASSDFYHGYNYEECKKSTEESKNLISSYRINDFYRAVINRNAACGGGPIITTMIACKMLKRKVQAIPLYITNSGDITGDKKGWIVGYGAFLIVEEEEKSIEWKPLDLSAQKELLKIARQTIETYVKNGKIPEFEPKSPILREKRGCFVTIRTKDGRLRGCIGHHRADTPLYKLVPKMAIASATQDYRFPPLKEEELKDIRIKLSIYLCEVYPIQDIDEFKLGEHGIIMKKSGRGATFLPEVPIEENWTKEETLEYLCRKAGLPSGCWREGAEFYLYKTQRFGE
jgi:hypothetical protein